MNVDATLRVLSALEKRNVVYVVIGGTAMNLHGLGRFTEDLDLFVQPQEDNIERLKMALKDVYEDAHIDEITSQDLLGEYPAVQYIPPEGPFHLDILTRLGTAFLFGDLQWERVDFEGVEVTVATPLTLYKMKHSTVRPKDWGDAAALQRHFHLGEG